MMIQGVGAAWAMTRIAGSPDMIALVQTASFLPYMLMAVPAGAIADTFNRRTVAIAAAMLSLVTAATLTLAWLSNIVSPPVLLLFCFSAGTASAFFAPTWQASVREHVPSSLLAEAISLNSVSFNLARSFGPALGGLLVALAGVFAAFVANAVLSVPMLLALFTWRRLAPSPLLPRESFARAVISGTRYIFHSSAIRALLGRAVGISLIGSAIPALMPLVARDLVKGGPGSYGVLLGAFGFGAVIGALSISHGRRRFEAEKIVRMCTVALAAATLVLGYSSSLLLSVGVLAVAGSAWMVATSLINVEIQVLSPNWVAGRTLGAFQASIAGGFAIGGALWGAVAVYLDITLALASSGVAMLASLLLSLWMRVPRSKPASDEIFVPPTPLDLALPLSLDAGPIFITISYCVDGSKAEAFHALMTRLERIRCRNGGFGWAFSRDIEHPQIWMERFQCPSWSDYLHMRSRFTPMERALIQGVYDLSMKPPSVRRMLDRPTTFEGNSSGTSPGL